jgi:hypothetical protein
VQSSGIRLMAVIGDGLTVSQAAEKTGWRVRHCTGGWPAMKPRGWTGWRIGRIGRCAVRVR